MSLCIRSDKSFDIDKGVSGILKFLCCFIIALHHFALHNPDITANSLILRVIAAQGGYLGVGIYFFLSGYGLTRSWSKRPLPFGQFVSRRFSKVYFPAVVISLIWVLVIFVLNAKGFTVSDRNRCLDVTCLPADLAKVLVFQFHDYILWFIGVILMLYLSFWVYKSIAGRWLSIAVFAVCIIAAMVVARFAFGSFATISIPLFAAGVFAAENSGWIGRHLVPFAIVSLAVILAVFAGFRHDMLMVHAVINFGAIWLLTVLFTLVDIAINVPKWIGDISFDVYLTHNKVILAAEAMMLRLPLAMFLLITVAVAALSMFLRKALKLS